MRERARAVNAELWVEDKNLHAVPRTDRNGERVNLAYGISLLTFQVRADLAHQCTELTVSGWDVSAKDLIREKATSGVVSGELNSGTSGGSILEKAFGERKASIVHTVPLTGEEAKAMAEARYRERARRFVTGSGSAEGNARIRVGTILTLSELGKMFNGDYYVVRVRHTYNSAHGFRTEFDVERPGIR
jgi:phage protein D